MRKLALVSIWIFALGCPAAKEETTTETAKAVTPAPADSGVAEKAKRPAPPLREATRAEAEKTLANLESWVKEGASDPSNAWALAHGITGFGKDLKTTDGRAAVDAIVIDYVQKTPEGWSFPPKTAEGLPVEPHKDLLIKTLLESGVPQDHVFKTKQGKVTLRQLFEDAEKRFAFPADDAGWRNYAWSEYAMILGNKSLQRIDTAKGPIDFKTMATKTLERLELEQGFLEPLLGKPEELEKRRQGIYAHHCGGLHFVQAAVLGAVVTQDPALMARARKQLDLVLFRWDAERRIYKETLWNEPKYRWLLLVQELKFYGHVLETFALAKDYGLIEPDDALKLKMRQIAGDLAETASFLEEAYKPAIKKEMPAQTQLDLIGDGCHAIRGLRRGLVAFFST